MCRTAGTDSEEEVQTRCGSAEAFCAVEVGKRSKQERKIVGFYVLKRTVIGDSSIVVSELTFLQRRFN